jgi:hypothetical protein
MRALLLMALLFATPAYAAPYTGMALLPLQAKSFPKETALDILTHSPRPTFAFAYKAFGSDPRNVHWLIQRLVDRQVVGDAPVRVSAYLTCGPCRSPRRTGPLALARFRPDLNIPDLNKLIERKDAKVLRDWRRWVSNFRAQFLVQEYSKRVEWRIYVELEDNLSVKSYMTLRKAARSILLSDNIQFARNRFGTPQRPVQSEAIEVHTYAVSTVRNLRPGDAVNGDGVDEDPTAAEYAEMKRRQVDFLLWRPEWQNPNTPLGQRKYIINDVRCLKKAMQRKVC